MRPWWFPLGVGLAASMFAGAVLLLLAAPVAGQAGPLGPLPDPLSSAPVPTDGPIVNTTGGSQPTGVPVPIPSLPALDLPDLPLTHVAAPSNAKAPTPPGLVPMASAAASAGWLVVLTSQLGGGFEAIRTQLAGGRGAVRIPDPASGQAWRLRAAARELSQQRLAIAVHEEIVRRPGASLATIADDLKAAPRSVRKAMRVLERQRQVTTEHYAGARHYFPARPR